MWVQLLLITQCPARAYRAGLRPLTIDSPTGTLRQFAQLVTVTNNGGKRVALGVCHLHFDDGLWFWCVGFVHSGLSLFSIAAVSGRVLWLMPLRSYSIVPTKRA